MASGPVFVRAPESPERCTRFGLWTFRTIARSISPDYSSESNARRSTRRRVAISLRRLAPRASLVRTWRPWYARSHSVIRVPHQLPTTKKMGVFSNPFSSENESPKRGLSLNRSQRGNCSPEYNTPPGNKVVCRIFRVSTSNSPKGVTVLRRGTGKPPGMLPERRPHEGAPSKPASATTGPGPGTPNKVTCDRAFRLTSLLTVSSPIVGIRP